eukprot:CAMPEP_0203686246 /NCGR_PEP_ID=MMETSP0090-20130426/48964_1 /ASSEMBLY_ACC=CAM_ASM_001088 /TAXON_ID=426623 /ORGANISM="Chaetoceros affinis, Strain CCMP159" /LENGTH=996 /DNA_ID=CAMNT_0050555467 /DNA_START=821 /DNA_END=3808 /DNA_ORIENTATION=-
MDKSIVSTKSLIDLDVDISSESECKLIDTSFSASPKRGDQYDHGLLYQAQKQRRGDRHDQKDNHHLMEDDDDDEEEDDGNVLSLSYRDRVEQGHSNQDQDREENVSIPSLVDASDFDEENQSQTSASTGTSSSLHSIKEGTAIGNSRSSTTFISTTAIPTPSTSTSTRLIKGDSSTASTSSSSSDLLLSERNITKLTTAAANNIKIQKIQQQHQHQHHQVQVQVQEHQFQSRPSSSSSSSSSRMEDRNPSQRSCERERDERNNNNDVSGTGTGTDSDSPVVRRGISDETVNTSNTCCIVVDMETATKEDLFLIGDDDIEVQRREQQRQKQNELQVQEHEHKHNAQHRQENSRESNHQRQRQQQQQQQQQDQQIGHDPNDSLASSSVNTNDTDDDTSYRYRPGIFERSITYITEVFSCSTPNIMTTAKGTDKSTTTDGGSNSNSNNAGGEMDDQLQVLQTCIEIDIFNFMGCSAEGAQQFIDSLGQSIFCQQCQCSSGRGGGIASKYCPKCNTADTDPAVTRPKILNRNVYNKSKAAKRIQRLREGGLSRHFSLSPVSTFLAEDMNIDVVHEEGTHSRKPFSQTLSKNGKKSSRKLIPLSKKPKSLSGDKRQTSLGGCSTSSQYEPTILATRSHDLSIDEDFDDEEERRTYKREVQSDTCGRLGSVVGERLLSRIFSSSRDQRNNMASEEQTQDDLYYDSDPGTHVGSLVRDKSELRKLVANVSSGRSKSVGIVGGFSSDLSRRLETNLLVSKKSLLATLDIYTFDINDSTAISMLIKELIASSFSLIWHPNKMEKSWSDSSTAPPHRVKAWFEMGSCLKKALLQPKFVWRSNDNMKYASRQMKVKSIHKPESIELLNIVRIVAPKEIDRQLHPFVKKECAFIIVTNTEEEYLFEAATQDERNKFVFAFKVMVARLASKIIVGDKDVFDEFFTPLGVAKKKKRRRRRNERKRGTSGNSGVIFIDEVDVGSDSFSVSSETSSNFCTVIVSSVEDESNR